VTLPNIRKRLQELTVAATESTETSATGTDYCRFQCWFYDLDKFVKGRKHRAPLIHNVSDIDFSCVSSTVNLDGVGYGCTCYGTSPVLANYGWLAPSGGNYGVMAC
jgi:hypothetical protein